MREPLPLFAKISIQSKIAELEARIMALEKARPIYQRVDREQASGIWKSFDALVAKVFK